LVRDADRGISAAKSGAAEIAAGNLTDRASLNAALKDIDTIF
jgi:uncharacterized protein YbjT (DUF2867 family)